MPSNFPLQTYLNNSYESVHDERQQYLLALCDLQAVKASGQIMS